MEDRMKKLNEFLDEIEPVIKGDPFLQSSYTIILQVITEAIFNKNNPERAKGIIDSMLVTAILGSNRPEEWMKEKEHTLVEIPIPKTAKMFLKLSSLLTSMPQNEMEKVVILQAILTGIKASGKHIYEDAIKDQTPEQIEEAKNIAKEIYGIKTTHS